MQTVPRPRFLGWVEAGARMLLALTLSVAAWIVTFWATSWAMTAIAYLVSPYGPSCVSNRPGVPFHATVPLVWVDAASFAVPTLLVGLYWVLGLTTPRWRVAGLIPVLALAALAFLLGADLTPHCT